jgi:hypothetical protein
MFAGGSIVGSLTPIVAGIINQSNGFQGVVIFAGAMATIGAVLSLILPMAKRESASP